MTTNETTLQVPRLLTLKQCVEEKIYPNIGGLRSLIFFNKDGFTDKVVKRINKKIFIDVAKFYQWVEETNSREHTK